MNIVDWVKYCHIAVSIQSTEVYASHCSCCSYQHCYLVLLLQKTAFAGYRFLGRCFFLCMGRSGATACMGEGASWYLVWMCKSYYL